MAQNYINQTSPWADVGNSLASSIAHYATMLPQIKLAQQRLAQQGALDAAHAQLLKVQAEQLVPAETRRYDAETGYYNAHRDLFGAQKKEIQDEHTASIEAGFTGGELARALASNAPPEVLQQKGQAFVEKFIPYAQRNPKEGLEGIARLSQWLRAQGKDDTAFSALMQGDAKALERAGRPIAMTPEQMLVGPKGNVVAPFAATKLNPGQSMNFNAQAVPQQEVNVPNLLPTPGGGLAGGSYLPVKVPGVTPEPLVSPVPQRDVGRPPFGVVQAGMQNLAYPKGVAQQIAMEAARKSGFLPPAEGGTNAPPMPSMPKVGDKRIVAGKNYQWDGKKWNPVK